MYFNKTVSFFIKLITRQILSRFIAKMKSMIFIKRLEIE